MTCFKRIVCTAAFCALVPFFTHAAESGERTLCGNKIVLSVEKPNSTVPERYSRFLGIWEDGKWDGVVCTVIVVESIDADGTAVVVYAFGDFQPWNIPRPGYVRVQGQIDIDQPDTLRAQLNNGSEIIVTYVEGSRPGLKARYSAATFSARTTLKKNPS